MSLKYSAGRMPGAKAVRILLESLYANVFNGLQALEFTQSCFLTRCPVSSVTPPRKMQKMRCYWQISSARDGTILPCLEVMVSLAILLAWGIS